MRRGNVLIVDDEPSIRDLLEDILEKDYDILKTENGLNALNIMESFKIDLVLADINMPVMNGIDFVKEAMKSHPDVAYLIISGNRDIDTAIDALHTGVWDFIRKPFGDLNALQKVIHDAMEKRRLLIENRKYKERLEEMVRRRTLELEMKNAELLHSRNRIIGILSRAAEFKDYETGRHLIRVSHYSGVIAKALGMTDEEVAIIRQAAPVHDIGKIGIPESILLKEGTLGDEEIREMQKHCLYGEQILKSRGLDDLEGSSPDRRDSSQAYPDNLLRTAASIAKNHHERIDGSGYPGGLRGEAIPLEAKIVAVADVYDALGSERPYKKAWPEEACQEYLRQNAGTLFDREVTEAFLANIERIIAIKYRFSDRQMVPNPV